MHRHYGDVNEKSNNFQGNDSINLATDFGPNAGVIQDGQTVTIGVDGATGTFVSGNDDDFVSVDDNSDIDFYRINLEQAAFIDVTLTPVGASYNQSAQGGGGGQPIDPSSSSNLTLSLFDGSGSLIIAANSGGLGEPEVVTGQLVANGDTFIRVVGNANTIQLYTLRVTADFSVPESTPPSAVTVSPGLVAGGDVSDLAESDNQTLDLLPEITGNPAQDSITAVLNYMAPTSTPTTLSFTVEGAVSSTNLLQIISLRNWDTGMFEVIDFRPALLEDDSVTITPIGDPQRFVQFPSGAVLAEIKYVPSGTVVGYPWTVRLDQAVINTVD